MENMKWSEWKKKHVHIIRNIIKIVFNTLNAERNIIRFPIHFVCRYCAKYLSLRSHTLLHNQKAKQHNAIDK